ncbi:hypothetical protein EDB83DRAFT_2321668 [Lactarius deliciosus]|nr:hypothetical protein EDB83DRAFT_2321668 [Lactarius deliciosus]
MLHKGGHEGVRTPLPFHAPVVRVAPVHQGGRGAGTPFARKRGQAARRGFTRGPPVRTNGVPFARVNEGTGGKGVGLPFPPPLRVNGRGGEPFPRVPGGGQGGSSGSVPSCAPSTRMGKERAEGGRRGRGGRGGTGGKGGWHALVQCTPLPREWGRERLRVASRILPFHAYRAPRPKEGGGPGIACPLSARTGRVAKGGGGVTCPRRADMGREGRKRWGMPSCAPLPRGHGGVDGKGRGRGAAGIVRLSANEGCRAYPFPCGSPFTRKLGGGAKGGSGPAWSLSCVYVNEVEGANEGYSPFLRPLCVNGRRAARKREGRGARGKWGPAVPAPVPPLRKNRDGGSKDLFPFPRKRRWGCKGRPGPCSCILFGRNRGGRGGKRGRPREEAEGGREGLCGVR